MKSSNNSYNWGSHNQFVADSLPAVQQLLDKVDAKRKKVLDFSPQSLHEVDAFLRELKNGQGTEDNPLDIVAEDRWWIVRLAYYFAEVLIKNLGGHWEFSEDKASKFYHSSYLYIPSNTKKLDPLLQLAASWQYGESLYKIYEFLSEA